jgi:hypothetical protein
MSAGSPPRKVR